MLIWGHDQGILATFQKVGNLFLKGKPLVECLIVLFQIQVLLEEQFELAEVIEQNDAYTIERWVHKN